MFEVIRILVCLHIRVDYVISYKNDDNIDYCTLPKHGFYSSDSTTKHTDVLIMDCFVYHARGLMFNLNAPEGLTVTWVRARFI